MHVGMAAVFQNTGRTLSDHQIYLNELALADMAEPLGFESIWSVEHHFTDYTMCPDVVQFLSYMAGRTRNVKLGSMVVVLPWHDPMRAAEQISMLGIDVRGKNWDEAEAIDTHIQNRLAPLLRSLVAQRQPRRNRRPRGTENRSLPAWGRPTARSGAHPPRARPSQIR